MSRESLPTHVDEDARDHDHRGHSHSRHHSHNRAGSHASYSSASLLRDKAPPAALDTLAGWTQETTASGKSIVTPAAVDALTKPYSPPTKEHNHRHSHHGHGHGHSSDHDHHHDHGSHHGHVHAHAHSHSDEKAERSLFTRTILPYTARFPILHAILVEKDSRRIFYFMT